MLNLSGRDWQEASGQNDGPEPIPQPRASVNGVMGPAEGLAIMAFVLGVSQLVIAICYVVSEVFQA